MLLMLRARAADPVALIAPFAPQVLELPTAPDLRARDLLLPAQSDSQPDALRRPLLPVVGPRAAPRTLRLPPSHVPLNPDSTSPALPHAQR